MSNNYAGKFVSAETAVKAVQPGDWVDYGFGAGFPELLDRALAARKDELTDVKIRGGLVIRPAHRGCRKRPGAESIQLLQLAHRRL